MRGWMYTVCMDGQRGLPTGNLARHPTLLHHHEAPIFPGLSHLLAVDDRIGVCRMADSAMDPPVLFGLPRPLLYRVRFLFQQIYFRRIL